MAAETALAIGGWFASGAVSMLSDSIRSFISGRYQIATGVRRKLESLDASVGKIKAVIGAVEKGITEDPNVVSWLNDLKDAVYDAEDVLDLFDIQYPCRSVEASGSKGYSTVLVNVSRKFVKEAQVSAKRFFVPDDSLRDLSDIVDKFDRLSQDIGNFLFLKVIKRSTDSYEEVQSFERRQTSPVPAISEMLGRSWAQDRLLELVSVSSDKNGSNSEKFSVVSIVGMGGMGKTTLAQWLYNHPPIKNQFDLMAWVCVSHGFNVRRVIKEIHEYASKDVDASRRVNQDLSNFGIIHADLSRLLSGKRFLIVLDDVWDDMATTDWDKLISVFRCGKEGSKIIVSTRDRRVAAKVGTVDTIDLAGLEDEEYWQLFKCFAFGDVNPKDHPMLEHIGKQIASKLGGLPLAAKVVGGVLKLRLEERHWRDVLENKEWQKDDEILPSLRLSYNYLPSHLKQCFVYCALFPKDYHFDIDKLVRIWVAQGYVQSSNETKTLEDVGREYFNELHCRSFFDYDLGSRYAVIHDLLHDLAESIFGDEIYREENGSSMEHKIPKRVRHLFVSASDLDRVLDQIKEPEKLRSLLYDPPDTRIISQTSCLDFKKLRGVRVLILGEHYSSSHLSETIGHMLHLRYLGFPCGIKVPISLGMLYNLQVLELYIGYEIIPYEALDNLELLIYRLSKNAKFHQFIDVSKSLSRCFNYQTTISEILGKLTNLRYTNVPCLISAIPSIGKLTSLQRLLSYEVREQEDHNICELRNLNKIQDCLCIFNLENVANKEEAKKAQLHNKVRLKGLSLGWNSNHFSNEEIRVHEEVLEGLQPHSNMKMIRISGYMGFKHPSWLNKSYLSNIESISLKEWGSLKVLPLLWEFPFLKYLYLDNLMSLETIGLELKERLALNDGQSLMPHLIELIISNCPNLKVIPPFGELPSLEILYLRCLNSLEKIGVEIYSRESITFPSLKVLELKNMSRLTECCALEEQGRVLMPCLEKLDIINCHKLKRPIPYSSVLKELRFGLRENVDDAQMFHELFPIGNLTCLKILTLSHLAGLESFTAAQQEWLQSLSALRELSFASCNGLRRLPDVLGSLCCLESLNLYSCDEMVSLGENSLPKNLKELNISNCGELQWLCDWREDGSEWSKISHIPCIEINGKVVPQPAPPHV